MNSKVFLEKQYYMAYCYYVIAGVITYKSENSVLNIFFKIYGIWAAFMGILLLPLDIFSLILADPEMVSYPQLGIGLLFHIPTVSRVFFFKFLKKKYEKVMCYLEYETLKTKDEEVLKTFQMEKETCRKVNKCYALSIFIGSFGFTIPSMVIGLRNLLGNSNENLTEVELAFPYTLPYNTHTAVGYAFGSLQLLIQVEMATLVFAGTDVLIAGLMRTTVCHLKCLAKWFSIIQTEKGLTNQANRKSEDEFKKAIEYLQRIYKGHRDVENIQHIMLFVQYICSTAILAVGLYRTSKDLNFDVILLKSCSFFILAFFQPFLYCYFGDMVTREAENVKQALYESDWIGSRIEYQRLVLLTLTRLNRPLIFTCGKLIILGNPAFLTIVNTAYSAFNLLNRSNEY